MKYSLSMRSEGMSYATRIIEVAPGASGVIDAIIYSIDTLSEVHNHELACNTNFIETEFVLQDGTVLTEHSLWSQITGEGQLLLLFEKAVLALEGCSDLKMAGPQLFMFQDAFQVLFYNSVVRKIPSNDIVLKVGKLFRRYLVCCELEFEYSEGMLVEWFFPLHLGADSRGAVELILYYMLSGQLVHYDFYRLNFYFGGKSASEPKLKTIVDILLNTDERPYLYTRKSVSFYYCLCALYYGENQKPRDELVAYIEANVSEPLRYPKAEQQYAAYKRIALQMEAHYCDDPDWRRRCDDTGFHRYDKDRKEWVWCL